MCDDKTQPAQRVLDLLDGLSVKEVILHADVPDAPPAVAEPKQVPLRAFAIELEQVHRASQPVDDRVKRDLGYGAVSGCAGSRLVRGARIQHRHEALLSTHRLRIDRDSE